MLEFKDFYMIAEYANDHWNCKSTPMEIAQGAYDWFIEYQMSVMAKEPTWNIKALLNQLKDDAENGSESAKEFAMKIENSIVTAAQVNTL